MRTAAVPLLLCGLLGAPAWAAQPARTVPEGGGLRSVQTNQRDVGSVERLEIVSLTRQHLEARVLTLLPSAATGPRQTFSGKVTVLNVSLPVAPEAAVSVWETGGRIEAAFTFELDLKDAPPSLPGQVRAGALDVQIEGALHGDGGSVAPVFAVGVLRYGTSDIQADRSLAARFVKLQGLRLSGLSLTTLDGEATAVLYNPFRFPIDLVDIRYILFVGERKVFEGSRHGVRIHPERENEVTLPLSVQNADLVAAAGSAAAGGRFPARLVGQIAVRAGNESVTMPLDLSGAVELGR